MKKILTTLFIMLTIACCNVPTAAYAASNYEISTTGGKKSTNQGAENYDANWATPSQSYLYYNADGTYNRVEHIGKYIYSEIYTADFQYKSRKKIQMELPVWGGIYITDDAYYVMIGQNNLKEKKGVAEFRLIKYDKNWKKLMSADITDANTVVPFDAGSCRFAQIDGDLYVRTCHAMYASEDGFNHQASAMFRFRMSDLSVLASYTDTANEQYGYISHSFNQFLAVKNGRLYACDHGDSTLRAISLMRFDETLSGKKYFDNEKVVISGIYPFYGEDGNNYTGATLGGFAISDTHCIAVGSSVKQTKKGIDSEVNNIYTVSTEAAGDFKETNFHWITNYSDKGLRTACNPHLVQISDQHYILIWSEEYNQEYERTCYISLDGTGKATSSMKTVYGMPLSDCQPIVVKDRIVWYATNGSSPTFYTIPADASAVPMPSIKTKFTQYGIVYQISKTGTAYGEVTVTGCKKSQMEKNVGLINITEYEGHRFRVTAIGKNAFKNNKKIVHIGLGNYIRKIGPKAFYGCSNLKSLTLFYKKYTTKNIGKNAFSKTKKLHDVLLPKKKFSAYKKLVKKRGVSSKAIFYPHLLSPE